MNQNKLKAKDLITTAIFTLLYLAIYSVVSTLIWMSVALIPFCVAVAMIPCGIVWSYMRVKTVKRFGILIQAALMAVIAFIIGAGWNASVGLLIGGLLAELLSGVGKYRSFKWNLVGYAVFAIAYNLGLYAIILIARDYYYEFCVRSGIDAKITESLINTMSGPLLLLTCALSAAGAVIGMLLGKLLLKKHFKKAGIV
jgi:energy-coupling factor transport system substrate-specific component